MKLSDTFQHPTIFTGEWPNWSGYTWLDYHKQNNVYHPGDDYNFGYGNQDLGQDVKAIAHGKVIHASQSTTGYGNIIIIKHQIGYNFKRFIKEMYGIETDTLCSFYAHLKDITVKVGDEVDAGLVIGHVGKSGTTWAHLHFEIYAPIGELQKLSWRFYPIGWSKEKISQYWLPAYKFIEASKQITDIADTFLGKSKEYWLQTEKDREALLKQVGESDTVWSKKLEEKEKEISSINKQVLFHSSELEKAEESFKKERSEFNKNIQNLQSEIISLKTRNTEILKDNAKNYELIEAVQLVLFVLKNKGVKV